jgi:hypothetical protein
MIHGYTIGPAWRTRQRGPRDIEWVLNRPGHPQLCHAQQVGPAPLRSLYINQSISRFTFMRRI